MTNEVVCQMQDAHAVGFFVLTAQLLIKHQVSGMIGGGGSGGLGSLAKMLM